MLRYGCSAVIDYRKWRMPVPGAVLNSEPDVLTPKERLSFWLLASGMTRKNIVSALGICKNTLHAREKRIRQKIPGLKSEAAYGALALAIINKNQNQVDFRAPLNPDRHEVQ